MNFIIANNMPKLIVQKLNTMGNIYLSTKLDIADEAVSYHPDMQIHFITDTHAICAPEVFDYYANILPDNITVERGASNIGVTYPKNCAYNIARVGTNIICNTKTADKKILDYYRHNNFNIIAVKQGYSKCNVAPLSDKLFITEDKGISKKASLFDSVECIFMPYGSVKISGFDYGFIGGATGLYDKKLLLCGKASDDIKRILRQYNIEYIELCYGHLMDYGSIISFE